MKSNRYPSTINGCSVSAPTNGSAPWAVGAPAGERFRGSGQHVECALTEPWALEIANQEREPCPPDCAACARIAEIEALS